MKDFISLREFLLIKEPYHDNREIYENKIGYGWVNHYDIAKKSFEKYGDNPPFGSIVEALKSGFGGSVGALRKLVGVAERDDRFFELKAKDENDESVSWSARSVWWREFRVVGETGNWREAEDFVWRNDANRLLYQR